MTGQSEALSREAFIEIYRYALQRIEEESVSVTTVDREIRALCWLIKQAPGEDERLGLLELSKQPEVCAQILRERATRNRPRAVLANDALRRFLEFALGERAAVVMESIEERLVPRRTHDWDEAERVVGGRWVAPLRAAQVLLPSDLMAISERAKKGKVGERAVRDEALVGLHCWSPLRAREIEKLRWEQISWLEAPEDAEDATFTVVIRVLRRGLTHPLAVHKRAAAPLTRLYAVSRRVNDREPNGPVFRSLRAPYDPLGPREIRVIVDEATSAISPHATRRDLLAAYADYLTQAFGYTAPDLRTMLGYSEVKHVRQLLRPHEAWRLNQKVEDLSGPIPRWDES